MTINKPSMTNVPTRQKVILVVTLLVFAVVVWQIVKLFKSDHTEVATTQTATMAAAPQPATPKSATLEPQQTSSTQPVSELAKLQQAMQDKYVSALNELQ